jgi:hypothetical protein
MMSWVYLWYYGRKLYLKSHDVAENVLAFWRSSGGGIYRMIVKDNVAEDFRKKYGRYGSIEITKVEPDNLLRLLRGIVDFAWREHNGIIYISAMRDYDATFDGRTSSTIGWWIGKQGWRIKEIKKILGKPVKVVDCIPVTVHMGYYVHTTADWLRIALAFHNPDNPDKVWRGVYNTRYCFALWRLKKVIGLMDDENKISQSVEAINYIKNYVKDLPFIRVNDDGVVEVVEG